MKKKKLWGIIGIVVAILVVIYIVGVATGTATVKPEEETIIEEEQPENAVEKYVWVPSDSSAERNTSERLDEILAQAKNDAESISEDDAQTVWIEAFKYLKAHANNFYENNDIMEISMYYGEFIYRYIEANATATNISELTDSTEAAYNAGYSTVKAIKYVYRNAETQEDAKAALEEAQTYLNMFE